MGTNETSESAPVDAVDSVDSQIQINLHFVRSYAAQLRRVADMYEQLEQVAKRPGSQLAPVLAVAGRMATSGLSQAGELLLVMFPDDGQY